MSLNLSIKAVPEALAERLRRRAERHHRSLQGELMAIIEAAAAEESAAGQPAGGAGPGDRGQAQGEDTQRTQGWKTVQQLLAERRARGWKPHPSLAGLPLGVDIVRGDRDSR